MAITSAETGSGTICVAEEAVEQGDDIYQVIIKSLSCKLTRVRLLCQNSVQAGIVMDHILRMLDDPSEILSKGLPWDSYSLRRLLLEISKSSNTFPPSSFCRTICTDRNAVALGGCADIFKAKLNGRIVALKRLRVFQHSNTRNAHGTYMAICREALVWHTLRHKFILPFIGLDQTNFKPYCCMVSHWMQHGNINDCIFNLLSARQDVPLARWFFEISVGLQYLHFQRVVHGDLRGANILINDEFRIQLADFGLSQFADASSASAGSHSGGAVRWLAPEMLRGSRSTYASDIYAFGCVWLEVYTHAPPFSELRHEYQVIAKVLEGARPEWPPVNQDFEDQISLNEWPFIRSCWTCNPDERPNITNLVDLCAELAQCTADPPDEAPSFLDSTQEETLRGELEPPLSGTVETSVRLRSLSIPSERPHDEELYGTLYEMENNRDEVIVVPSTAIRTDINWFMPNWPFMNDASMEEAVWMPLSLLEQDSVLTNSTSSTRAGYDTSSISSFGSYSLESELSSIPSSPASTSTNLITTGEGVTVAIPLQHYPLAVIPEGVEEDIP